MYIEVDNKKTYVATGSKDHVDGNLGMTFVHGTGMDHTVWTLAGRHFARKGLNIHAVDLPGHGRSEGTVVDSIEAMADWVISVLDTTSKTKQSLLVIAWDLWLLYPSSCQVSGSSRYTCHGGTSIPMPVGDVLLDGAKDDLD